jgi:O-antigen chain-terminating methyltransferase
VLPAFTFTTGPLAADAPHRDSTSVEQCPVAATAELEHCLNQVEYYQPLYGITGFEPPLRDCRDRALAIASAIAPVGNNTRLIDFGSSLGYFPFFFADRGAVTTGLDINPANTAVALATQRLNGLSANFFTARLDRETVSTISPGEYDIGLILSVLHHITHQHGLDYVRQLLADLLDRIPTLVLELALADEDNFALWRTSLPKDPLAILSGCRDIEVRSVGRFRNHLSKTMRPIYVVTRQIAGTLSLP